MNKTTYKSTELPAYYVLTGCFNYSCEYMFIAYGFNS